MEQKMNKNAQAGYRASAESVAEEIKALLKEFFVGELQEEDHAFVLQFENGQRFRLCLEEV